MNFTRSLLLLLGASLLTAACGQEEPELGTSGDELTIVAFSGPTCTNVIDLMAPTANQVPFADVDVRTSAGLLFASMDYGFVNYTSTRLTTADSGRLFARPVDASVVLRKRTMTLGGRVQTIAGLLVVSFVNLQTGATFEASVTPTECTVNNGVGTVTATGPNGEQIQVTYFKESFS
jgi:hypothetical protein